MISRTTPIQVYRNRLHVRSHDCAERIFRSIRTSTETLQPFAIESEDVVDIAEVHSRIICTFNSLDKRTAHCAISSLFLRANTGFSYIKTH